MCVRLDHFNWTCANVLIGLGDPYSIGGAEAFEKAAKDKQIDICKKSRYLASSGDMEPVIEEIIAARCCRVTVVFGQAQDLASLFLEAHRQNFDGEWIVGESLVGLVDDVVNELKTHLPEAEVHKSLQGMYAFAWQEVEDRRYDNTLPET